MSSTGTNAVVEQQAAKLGELYSTCSRLAAEEERKTGRIVGTMVNVLGWLKEPVVLDPKSLGDSFGELRSVVLDSEAKVVMEDVQGKVSSKRLGDFRTEECLAILEQVCPELERLVSNKRRATQVRPALSLKLVAAGSKLIVDRRSYRLVVSNSGGDCVGLKVSTQLPGGADSRSTRPHEVKGGAQVEVDLEVFKELEDAKNIKVEIDCKDTDGRTLFWDGSLSLERAGWHEAPLHSA